MSNPNEKLTAVIDELVEQRTFSLEGIEAVKRLRDGADRLEAEAESLRTKLAEKERLIESLTEESRKRAGLLAEWLERDAALVKREANITMLEKREAVADATAKTLDTVFTRIFANRVVRETITKNNTEVHPTSNGGYPSTFPTSGNETTEREES